jgi:predicted nuclease of predicted toxin-antitoxin system
LMFRFKIDENMPVEGAAVLTQAGHDALTVRDQQMGGRPDADVVTVCRQERRALVTLDLDFADIRAYPPADYAGIIVLRLSRLDKLRVLHALERVLPILENEPLAGKLWIVDETAVRIRG